jgi:hypothetical protein
MKASGFRLQASARVFSAPVVLAVLAACASGGLRESTLDPSSSAPVTFTRLAQPPAPVSPAPAGGERAATSLGAESLVATPTGLFVHDAAGWSSIDRDGAPVVDAVDLAPRPSTDAPEAWVREPNAVFRLRLETARAAWFKVPLPATVGAVRGMAPLGARLALATDRGVAVVDGDDVRLVHARDGEPAPSAIAGAGGAAWIAWGDAVLRTDGYSWTALARGLSLGTGARILPEDDGASATVVDAQGTAYRIVGAEGVRVAGFPDHLRTADTRLDLAAIPADGTDLVSVDYFVDGARVATRTQAPWGWGLSGAPALDVATVRYGAHVVRVDAKTKRGHVLTRTRAFDYTPPASGVPSYARDIVPLFRARCASCHDQGVARDLTTYERMRSIGARLRSSIRERRMPPDFAIDEESIAVFTAWVDGDSPR